MIGKLATTLIDGRYTDFKVRKPFTMTISINFNNPITWIDFLLWNSVMINLQKFSKFCIFCYFSNRLVFTTQCILYSFKYNLPKLFNTFSEIHIHTPYSLRSTPVMTLISESNTPCAISIRLTPSTLTDWVAHTCLKPPLLFNIRPESE